MRQFGSKAPARRVSAAAVAALLASDGWVPARERPKPRRRGNETGAQRTKNALNVDRAEAMPAGHPVSWNALWGGDRVPAFPGLMPIGAYERCQEIH